MFDVLVSLFWAAVGLLQDALWAYEGAVAAVAAITIAVSYALVRARRRRMQSARESNRSRAPQ